MVGMTLDQVRAADVADLAVSVLGLGQGELLAADGRSAEAVVAAAQRVISALSAVQAVAIEAWGRREGEQLGVDKVVWAAMSAAAGVAGPGGGGARFRLLDGVPRDEHDFMPSYLAPVLRLSPRSARRRYESARILVGSLPLTLAAMRSGDLEPHRAQQVVDEVPAGDVVVCAAVERALFPRIVQRPGSSVGALARRAVAGADPGAAARLAVEAQRGRFVFAGPSGLPGLMRFEAEVEAGKGARVWAAIQELAADYLKEGVAASMDQARADAFVDLALANVSVTTVVDLALPAGFATTGGAQRPGSCLSCDPDPATRPENGVIGGSVLEDRATAVLVDADQNRGQARDNDKDANSNKDKDGNSNKDKDAETYSVKDAKKDSEKDGQKDSEDEASADGLGGAVGARAGPPRRERDGVHANVIRILAGLPSAVLDHRAGALSGATIEAILADPDTVFRRLVLEPETGWLRDAGARTYQPGRHLARTVRKRDLHCRFPRVPARPGSATRTT